MKRKDILASGSARSATFAGGSGENDIFRNVAPEDSRDESIPAIEPVTIARKRFIPNADVLLVRRAEPALASTLVITDTMEKEQPSEGTVLAAGSGVSIPVGAHVVFGKYSGAEFKLNGETLLLMDWAEVKGTLVDVESEQEHDGNRDWINRGVCISGIPRA